MLQKSTPIPAAEPLDATDTPRPVDPTAVTPDDPLRPSAHGPTNAEVAELLHTLVLPLAFGSRFQPTIAESIMRDTTRGPGIRDVDLDLQRLHLEALREGVARGTARMFEPSSVFNRSLNAATELFHTVVLPLAFRAEGQPTIPDSIRHDEQRALERLEEEIPSLLGGSWRSGRARLAVDNPAGIPEHTLREHRSRARRDEGPRQMDFNPAGTWHGTGSLILNPTATISYQDGHLTLAIGPGVGVGLGERFALSKMTENSWSVRSRDGAEAGVWTMHRPEDGGRATLHLLEPPPRALTFERGPGR